MKDANPFSPPASRVEDAPLPDSNEPMRYAGFWQRFGAYWVDFLLFLPIIGLSLWMGQKTRLFNLYYFFPGLLIGLWFHVYLVKQYGGTPGKLLLKIRIARLDGTAVGYKEAVIRHSVLFVLTTFTSIGLIVATLNMPDSEYFSLGFQARTLKLAELAPRWYQPVTLLVNVWIWSEFIVMLLNKRRRAPHDFMAGTVVLRRV